MALLAVHPSVLVAPTLKPISDHSPHGLRARTHGVSVEHPLRFSFVQPPLRFLSPDQASDPLRRSASATTSRSLSLFNEADLILRCFSLNNFFSNISDIYMTPPACKAIRQLYTHPIPLRSYRRAVYFDRAITTALSLSLALRSLPLRQSAPRDGNSQRTGVRGGQTRAACLLDEAGCYCILIRG